MAPDRLQPGPVEEGRLQRVTGERLVEAGNGAGSVFQCAGQPEVIQAHQRRRGDALQHAVPFWINGFFAKLPKSVFCFK